MATVDDGLERHPERQAGRGPAGGDDDPRPPGDAPLERVDPHRQGRHLRDRPAAGELASAASVAKPRLVMSVSSSAK